LQQSAFDQFGVLFASRFAEITVLHHTLVHINSQVFNVGAGHQEPAWLQIVGVLADQHLAHHASPLVAGFELGVWEHYRHYFN
jgi:hypothetical protein